jgi:hypothetical protein
VPILPQPGAAPGPLQGGALTTSTRGLTWQEIVRRARAEVPAAHVGTGWIMLRWVVAVDRGDIAQEVLVRPRHAFDEGWIELVAPIDGVVNCRAALARGAETCIGALAIEDGSYVVRHVAPLASVTWPELKRALEWVAREAVTLKWPWLTGPGQQDSELFKGFA